ncbi:MAG: Arm DNA-binding domain-containing protein [Actinomycetota bacterium]|nr:Arm DNA-binding domain-containing protein [Actinomycetota bacterium]
MFKRGRTWSYVVDVGPSSDGRRRQQMKGGFATKREADRALREVLRTLDVGSYVAPSQQTVAGFLVDEWLPAIARRRCVRRLGRSTAASCAATRSPASAGSPCSSWHLNAFYAELLTAGRVDGRGGLSPKTVLEIHVILHKALKDAVRWGRLSRNVAALADPPSQRAAAATRRRSMQTWSPSELHRFLTHDPEDRLHYAWVLAATTGMRRSELLGLRWADVDLTASRLAVRQRLASVDGHPELSEPKSNRSGRVIDLDERTVAALRARRAEQAEHRLMCGPAWHDLDLVVTREDGL